MKERSIPNVFRAVLSDESAFPVCVGKNQSAVKLQGAKKHTCILCQETEELDFNGRAIVLAAYVQKSTLFSKSKIRLIENPESHDPLFMPDSLFQSVHTSVCGHTMHADCWQQFYDAVVAKERRRPLHLARLHSLIDIDNGEYLCPLCKRLSNTVLPLLPPLGALQIDRSSPDPSPTYEDWIAALTSMTCIQDRKSRETRVPRPGSSSRKRSRSSSAPPSDQEMREEEGEEEEAEEEDHEEVEETEGAEGAGADSVQLFSWLRRGVHNSVLEQFKRLLGRMSNTHDKVPMSQGNYDMVRTSAQAIYTVCPLSPFPILKWM